jgi:soluble lytic murein transglycosylase
MHSPREFAHAIILQESRFESTAASSAGAQGLMQLMPETARRMAPSLRLNYHRPRLVSDPAYNIRLGSAYLNYLLELYDGNPVLAIAAYNAGPGSVRKWVQLYGDPRQFDTIDQVIDWMEMIPFAETRNYVQRVLENIQIYRGLSGNSTLMIEQDIQPLANTYAP